VEFFQPMGMDFEKRISDIAASVQYGNLDAGPGPAIAATQRLKELVGMAKFGQPGGAVFWLL
jgi:hypothetical protein